MAARRLVTIALCVGKSTAQDQQSGGGPMRVRCSQNYLAEGATEFVNTCQEICIGNQMEQQACPDIPECPLACPDGPTNCTLQEWQDWTDGAQCSGLQSRTRGIISMPTCGGAPCEGDLQQTRVVPNSCNPQTDCSFTPWGVWTPCVNHQQMRTRTVSEWPAYGGRNCTLGTVFNETQSCNLASSTSRDCDVGDWLEWGICTDKCRGGTQTRFRVIGRATGGGEGCAHIMRQYDEMYGVPLPEQNVPTVSEMRPCSNHSCEVANAHVVSTCDLGDWSDWSACIDQRRQRGRALVNDPQSFCIAPNVPLEETEGCTVVDEPVECVVADWSEWSMCSKTCDGGQTTRTREVLTPASHSDHLCNADLEETQACVSPSCASAGSGNCHVSLWAEWGSCTSTGVDSCGTGQETRSRVVQVEASQDGIGCDMPLGEVRGCNLTTACERRDCVWNAWTPWSACSWTCGGGVQFRNRTIGVQPSAGGAPCDPIASSEVQGCNAQRCGHCIDGSWGQWSAWDTCSKTCSTGYQKRNRDPATTATECGIPALGNASEYQRCNENIDCHVNIDCTFSQWTAWSACSSTCLGMRNRSRHIAVQGEGHGTSCGDDRSQGGSLNEMESCNSGCGGEDERQDCVLGAWSAWTPCSTSCGVGQEMRERVVLSLPRGGGDVCSQEPLVATQGCNRVMCNETVAARAAVHDCQWSSWSIWSACTSTSGQKFRHRRVTVPAAGGGIDCAAENSEETGRCERAGATGFCVWQPWGQFSECSETCGSGHRQRSRSLEFRSEHPGEFAILASSPADCSGNVVDVALCSLGDCRGCQPQNCVLTAWSEWTTPDCEQYTGVCAKSRDISVPNNECGAPCNGSLRVTKECLNPACSEAQDGELGAWSAWVPATCADGNDQQYRSRIVTQAPTMDGDPVVAILNDTRPCGGSFVDCALGSWGDWSACDSECGSGQKARNRTLTQASNGGRGCFGAISEETVALSETTPCEDLAPCGSSGVVAHQDCQFGDWSGWAVCTGIDNEQTIRERQVLVPASGQGASCQGPLNQTRTCNGFESTVNCLFSSWTEWSSCSGAQGAHVACGGGQTYRTRNDARPHERGGSPCTGSLTETKGCNELSCADDTGPMDCQLTTWLPWSPCSATCGFAIKNRSRTVTQAARLGGHCTHAINQIQQCEGLPECPSDADCEWEEWNDWQQCVRATGDCGTGFAARSRGLASYPSGSGRMCPPRTKTELFPVPNCTGQPECCINGEWADWGPWSECSASCDSGVRMRRRGLAVHSTWCGQPPVGGGSFKMYQECSAGICADVDCAFGDWSTWSNCSDSCHGHRMRSREIANEGSGSGASCSGPLENWERCSPAPGNNSVPASCTANLRVPVDCQMNDWSNWTACTATTGRGVQQRSRTTSTLPEYGGQVCPSILSEARTCTGAMSSAEIDCVWSDWTDWGACANSQRTRSRTILTHEVNGYPCQGSTQQIGGCGTSVMSDFFCEWGNWMPWADCSASCGAGATRTRFRSLQVNPVDEVQQRFKLPDLQAKLDEMQSTRLQEIAGAFAFGAVSLVFVAALVRFGSVGVRGLWPSDAHTARYQSIQQHPYEGMQSNLHETFAE